MKNLNQNERKKDFMARKSKNKNIDLINVFIL